MMAPTGVPPELTGYYDALVGRLVEVLGRQLVGAYAFGSVALGDWDAARSDVDVAVVCRDVDRDRLARVAASLDHAALPVPARKLELVVYESTRARAGDLRFTLNLNTGRDDDTTADYDPAIVPDFWFVLDVAIARDRAPALFGPPASALFAELGASQVDAALEEALRWQRSNPDHEGAIMAACRAWHHRATGTWTGKTIAAGWAVRQLEDEDHELAALVAEPTRGSDDFFQRGFDRLVSLARY